MDVTFPSAGVWEWEITPDPFPLVTDAAVIGRHSHTSNAGQEAGHHTTDLKPVTEFAPLTVSTPPQAIFGVKQTDAARAGSVVVLVMITAAGVALAVRRSVARRGERGSGTDTGQAVGG